VIAVVVLVLAIVWVLFVPVADWLAHHDVGTATGSLHETALDNARDRLLTLGAGLLAAGALLFTALNFNLLRRSSEKADQWQRRSYELTEQSQVTERYTKAIEQLGSSTVDVTIGGIFALERIANDSPRDHSIVMEVLAACVREHSNEPLHEATAGRGRPEPEPETRPDIQAAVTVIGRRDTKHDGRRINLRQVHLPGADLPEANLAGANLTGANLTGAVLSEANLSYADLTDAKLSYAKLGNTKLTGANLIYALLHSADLTGAKLRSAKLTYADLSGADLTGADLSGADLTAADLSGADLTGALWPADMGAPEGWRRRTDSDSLERSDIHLGEPSAS
jgi:Pentapeptide repeats (8 copies)